MSQAPSPQQAARLTIASIARLHADGERIAMLTAYDFPTARILDDAGIPMLLVGDSLGQVMLGYDSTVRVTMAEMLHHTKAVVRGTNARPGRGRHAVPLLRRHARDQPRERRRPHERGRRRRGQARGRRAQRPHDRDDRPGRHPGHGPHRPDARSRSTSWAGIASRARRARPGASSWPTLWRSSRPEPSPSSWSWCRSSWRRPSPSGSTCPRSASAPEPAARARSRW